MQGPKGIPDSEFRGEPGDGNFDADAVPDKYTRQFVRGEGRDEDEGGDIWTQSARGGPELNVGSQHGLLELWRARGGRLRRAARGRRAIVRSVIDVCAQAFNIRSNIRQPCFDHSRLVKRAGAKSS